MNYKNLTILILVFCGICQAKAQSNLNATYSAFQKKKIPQAKYLIDSIAEMQVNEKDAEVWYLNGLIYEHIFFSKDSATRLLSKNALVTAGDSYYKVIFDLPKSKFTALCSKKVDTLISKNLLLEGKRLEKLKRIDDAISHFELYTKINKTDTSGLIQLAMAADKADKYALAEENYNKLLSLNYANPFVFKALFLVLEAQEKYNEALKIEQKAIKLYNKDQDWTLMEISLNVKMNMTQLAIKKLDSASVKFPEKKKIFTFNIGAIYDRMDSVNKAIEYYKKALEFDSDYFAANFNLGAIYYNKARTLYTDVNSMLYNDYLKVGKIKEYEGHEYSKNAMPYFEKCYQVQKEENVKLILKDIYRNLDLGSKLRDLERN